MSTRAKPGEHVAWIEAACHHTGDECLVWPFRSRAISRNGGGPYGSTRCTGQIMLAHRLVLIRTLGEPAEGMEARHSCDNSLCCNPSHLSWGTYLENADDKVAHGRTRLTLQQVGIIRESPDPHSVLAARFSVTPKAIRDVRTGRSWKRYLDA